MLVDYEKFIAYICPYCGRLTQVGINVFDIPPEGRVFKCSDPVCAAEVLILRAGKKSYIAEIICTACGEKHRFTLKKQSFWQKHKLTLSCPETAVDILFLGDKGEVEAELKKQDELYRKAEEEICADPDIRLYFDIIREVNEIAKADGVYCRNCGSHMAAVELTEDGIHLVCRDCGAQKIIEVSKQAYLELLEDGTIVLDKK